MSPAMPPTGSRWIASDAGAGSAEASGDDRHDIRSFGDDGERRIAGARERLRDGIVDGFDALDAGERALLLAEPGRVELHAARAHRLELHLGLPLVDVGEALGEERLQERVGADLHEALLCGAEVARAETFRARGGDDQ